VAVVLRVVRGVDLVVHVVVGLDEGTSLDAADAGFFTSASPRSASSCRGGPGLVEVEELTVQAAVWVEVATRNLDPSRDGDATHLERVEAGGAD
jgi:hypothetical protein